MLTVVLALLAAAGYSGSDFTGGLAAREAEAGSSTDLWPLATACVAGVAVVFCAAVAMRQVGLPPGGNLRLCIGTGFASAAGTYAFFLATHQGLLAITAVITSLYPAGTIVLARLLLHERLTRLLIAGLCLAAVSIGLIAASTA